MKLQNNIINIKAQNSDLCGSLGCGAAGNKRRTIQPPSKIRTNNPIFDPPPYLN